MCIQAFSYLSMMSAQTVTDRKNGFFYSAGKWAMFAVIHVYIIAYKGTSM
jgi:hypothetical protein